MFKERSLSAAALLSALVLSGACGTSAGSSALPGGDAGRGKEAIARYACGACHTIPGIEGANAVVGPPLSGIAVRKTLGGHLENTPANMVKWIQHPQQIDPKNVMPELGVTEQDAKDITAYLYTLK
ncbi:MAG: c-type cytochrome [Vicinamibacterales bacterium]